MDKVVITILRRSVVLNIHSPIANFIQFTCAKNNENWLRVDKVIAMKTVCSFWPTR